ncbi:MAG: hypothetical protein WCI27_01080 [Candidatus Omnitrophota bacterium]
MKRIVTVFIFAAGFMSATLAIAQVYEKQYKNVTGPMDRTVAQSKADWSDVPNPGDSEWSGSRAVRYKNMTGPIDAANRRHFNTVEQYQTVNELPNGEVQDQAM